MKTLMQKITCSLIAASLLLSQAANAATATQNFNVTATVVNACTLSSISDLAFGNYSFSAPSLGTTSVNVTCSLGSSYTLHINDGLYGSSASTRKMKHGTLTDNLSYTLSNSLAGATWGDTAGTGVTGTGLGVAVPTTIYGSVAANQTVTAGSYSDTLTMTVTF